MPVSGTGFDNDLLKHESVMNMNLSDLYPNDVTLCGQSNRRVVGQILKKRILKMRHTHAIQTTGKEDEVRTITLANAIVSLDGDQKAERFYRRLILRLSW
tara:strand:+ start:182 stop:481 length:300 start_codon:yes stop_codon:yes gene_type:complete